MSKFKLGLAIVALVILSGCSNNNSQSTSTNNQNQQPAQKATDNLQVNDVSNKKYSLDEVKKHASATDCWTIIDGKVYNITAEINKHPGGPKIMQGCGIDSSDMYKSVPKHRMADLDPFFIGTLGQ